jgi:hypothetical protein
MIFTWADVEDFLTYRPWILAHVRAIYGEYVLICGGAVATDDATVAMRMLYDAAGI